MKKSSFVAGFVLGGMLFGGVSAIAANGMMATPSSQSLFVDGTKVDTEAYNINGSNYFKLRDVGQAVNFAVEYDEAANAIKVDTSKKYGAVQTPVAEKNKEKQNQTTVGLKANKSVAPQFDANGRPISIATKTGDIIYGTGNDKTRNPNAIGEWAGYFEITGDGKPLEPALGSYDPNWQGYQDIKWPNPIPAYSNIGNSVWEDGKSLFVFNAHETQRLIDQVYRELYAHPECFTDGHLNNKVMIGMTEYGFNTNHHYPYQDSEVKKQVVGGGTVLYVYAVDVYQNGMFDCTKYIVMENGGYDYKTDTIELWDDLLNSETAVVSNRQDK